MEDNKRWVSDYIENMDLSKIEWLKLKEDELMEFFEENYIDKDGCQYVCSSERKVLTTPLGLHYLTFDNPPDKSKYLLGIVNNNICKKTIVAAMVYFEHYYIFKDQEVPLTYISTVETNSYFRNKGVYNKLCEKLIKFINTYQHILISEESDMGRKYNVVQKLQEALVSNGFTQKIWIDHFDIYRDSDFYDAVVSKKM